ncbi:MAG: YdbH domain-containing protein [Tepidisphaeraceae bacterium]
MTVKDPSLKPARRRPRIRRVLIAVGAVVLLGAAAWFIGLPWLLRNRVNAALRDAGVRAVRFDVARATPWGSRLDNVVAGPVADPAVAAEPVAAPVVQIERVDLSYSLRDLWHGRLDAIKLRGANVTLHVVDGNVDLRPLEALVSFGRRTKTGSATRPSTGGGFGLGDGPLPLELFSFDDSLLTFVTPTRTVEVPVSGSINQDPSQRLKVRLDAGDNHSLMLEGTIDPAAKTATFSGGAHPGRSLLTVRSIWPQADVTVDGKLLLRGSANLTTPADLTASATLAIVKSSADSTSPPDSSGGKLHIEQGVLQVAVEGPSKRRRVRLDVKDVSLASDQGFSAEGVAGEIVLSRLTPPQTLPSQLLRAAKVKIGDVEFTNGELEFEVIDGRTMLVRETRWDWLGGQALAQNVRVSSGRPLHATLSLRNVELKQLLASFAGDKLEGEGKLSGELPITVQDGKVNIGNGQLTSLQGGQLRMKDRETIDKVVQQVGAAEQVKENVTEALQDFEYNRMSARFSDEPDGLLTRLQFGGRGRTGDKQVMTFDLRITGVQDLINLSLGLHSAVSAARERIERGVGNSAATIPSERQ